MSHRRAASERQPQRRGHPSGGRSRNARAGPGSRSRPVLHAEHTLFALIPVLAALAGVAVFLQREWALTHEWGFSLDDSWIHAVFARNIATGNGYAFNPGEPVSGSTGPLYSILLALAYGVTGEMTWSAKMIGILCHVVVVLQMYRAASRLSQAPWVPIVVATMTGLSPPLLWGSVSGMEITLYLALLCSGLERYLAGHDVAAALFWSLGVWVRPDGIFLVVLGMLGPSRTLWRRAAAAAAVIAPFFAFNEIIGGSIFPQTVAAKTRLAIDLLRTGTLLRQWAAIWGVPFRTDDQLEHPVVFLPFLVLGILLTLRKKPILGLYAVGLPIAFSMFRDNSGSHKRYLIPVIPFGILLALIGLRWLSERFAARRATAAFVSVAAACLVWQITILNAKATTHGWNVQNINMMQRVLGETTRQATYPDAVIAASDIGAIKYFSQRKVIDLMGLVSRPRSLPENLSYWKPDVMIVIVPWFKAYVRRDPTTNSFVFYDQDSTHKYTPLAVIELRHNTICAGDQMVAFGRQRLVDPPLTPFFRRY